MEEQRVFASFINVFVCFITKQWFARFLKTFIRLLPKLSATRTLRLCRSLCLRHLREIVCFHLRVLPLSVWLLYVVGLIYHSIFRKNQKKVGKRRNKHRRISTFFSLKTQKAAQKLWFKLLPLCNIHFCVSVLMHKHLHHFGLVWSIKSLFWGIAYRRFCLSRSGVVLKCVL